MKRSLPDQNHWILLSREVVTVTDGPLKLTGTAVVAKGGSDGRAGNLTAWQFACRLAFIGANRR